MLSIQTLLILVIALCVSMLILYSKKKIPVVSMDLFVDFKNDIIRESGISFPKNRVEVPRLFMKQIVAGNKEDRYDCDVGAVSNSLYTGSVRSRSPTLVNGRGSCSRC